MKKRRKARPADKPLPITLPLAAAARMHYDRVTDTQGNTIGLATYPGYTANERAMMSLASVDAEFAEPGTEVVLLWGEDGGGSRSAGGDFGDDAESGEDWDDVI